MTKIIKNPINLLEKELSHFSDAFRSNNYEIITSVPTADNAPESLIAAFTDKTTFERILDDKDSHFNFFSIRYSGADLEDVIIPIGLYGISGKWRVRFPFIVNGFWQMFFMSNKKAFCAITEIDENGCDIFYSKMIELKKELMRKIFMYYYSLDAEFRSVMAWDIRGEKSDTRKIAEALHFFRNENNGSEIYSSADFDDKVRQYLIDCRLRWGILIDDKLQNISNVNYSIDKIQYFIRSIVDYRIENN